MPIALDFLCLGFYVELFVLISVSDCGHSRSSSFFRYCLLYIEKELPNSALAADAITFLCCIFHLIVHWIIDY